MKVLILGADGYLGWPTAMYLSRLGYDVSVVDNYFRRWACHELDIEPLISVPNLQQRAQLWKDVSGIDIQVAIGDITDYSFLSKCFTGQAFYTNNQQPITNNSEQQLPDAVVHYAEQPSAPYSMMDYNKASFTLRNNLMSTLNLVFAVKEVVPDCHIVKLGTMGEYGTPNIDIEEGWIEIEHKGRNDKFLFPRQAGSLYHTTKIHDTDLLWFYVRTWNIKVTDLMQGPVYGVSTEETDLDLGLLPNFHYDEIFGTVLNRFIVQAVIGHPLTIYGGGGQTRGYLNIKDTMECINLSILDPPQNGQLRILNQFTETFSVKQLAEMVKKVGTDLGYPVEVKHYENPRVEKEEHYYNPKITGLLELGLKPNYLTDNVLENMFRLVEKYADRINKDAIFKSIRWK